MLYATTKKALCITIGFPFWRAAGTRRRYIPSQIVDWHLGKTFHSKFIYRDCKTVVVLVKNLQINSPILDKPHRIVT